MGFSFLLSERHTQLLQVARIAAGRQMIASDLEPKPHDFLGLMVKCTPERGHNALFFIPLEVFIML